MLFRCSQCGWSHDLRVSPRVCPKCGGGRTERNRRVMEAVARTNRIVSWLSFLRHPSDAGAGDTATRLQAQCRPHVDAYKQLTRLLKQCGCEKTEARVRLNERFPYG